MLTPCTGDTSHTVHPVNGPKNTIPHERAEKVIIIPESFELPASSHMWGGKLDRFFTKFCLLSVLQNCVSIPFFLSSGFYVPQLILEALQES